MTVRATRASELPRWLRGTGAIFTPPETFTGSYESLQNVGLRLQLALVTAAVGAIWLAPGLDPAERLQVTALLVIFVAYSLTSAKASLRSPLLRLLSFPTDLLAVFAFAFVVPATTNVVLFAALLLITFHTYTCGRTAGLLLGTGVMALAVAVRFASPAEHRLVWFTLVLYGVILGLLTLMVDGLARERRREARHLARLHRALRSLAPAPDLEATLRSVSEAVREAVGAQSVVVRMHTDDEPGGATVEVGSDTVAVPLGPPEDPVGVLQTYFADGDQILPDDVDLIVAYAQQASLVIARAIAYEQQRLAAARLEEADALKSEFVSTVSHELRTPLTAVRGFVGTILAQWPRMADDERRFLLERVDWNARELSDLIEQVLDFSRIEAGHQPLELTDVDLASQLATLVDRLGPALGATDVDLQVPPGLVVKTDVAALERIVTNLLTNAAKFAPVGSLVEVGARASGDEVVVSVRDDGPGIAPEDQERVFERFYRAGPTAGKRGTGIGLAIVRSYVERLGGRVWLDSVPGDGATFSVALLAAPSELAADAEGTRVSSSSAARRPEAWSA